MAQKGDLLSVREDIRVVDATIRDGGLVIILSSPTNS